MATDRALLAIVNAEPSYGDDLGAFIPHGPVSASDQPLRPVPGLPRPISMGQDLHAGGEALALILDRPSARGRACIHVAGSLSVRNVRALMELLDRLLADGCRWVLVDARQLSGPDAGALSSLRASYRQFVRTGGSLLIRGVRLEMLDHTWAVESAHTTAFRPAARLHGSRRDSNASLGPGLRSADAERRAGRRR